MPITDLSERLEVSKAMTAPQKMAEGWRYLAAPASDYCKKTDTVLRRVRKITSKKQDMTRGFEGMHIADSMHR